MERAQLHQAIDAVLDLRQAVIGRVMPSGAGQHFREARREALRGVRALLDGALERMEREEAGSQTAGTRSIPVDEA